MEVQDSTLSQEAIVTSTPDTSSETPVVSATGEETSASGEVVAQAPAPYVPNFKYKVHDKEHEFDEFVRGAVKDAETEKKLRDLYSAAKGLDEVKAKREKLSEEYTSYKKDADPIVSIYSTAASDYQKGLESFKAGNHYDATARLDRAFATLGVDQKVLQTYVYHKLAMNELPPQVAQQYTKAVELERQNMTLQQQMESAQAQQQELKTQQRQFELSQTLAAPEVSPIQQAFDQRQGQGAFQTAVWNFAGVHYQRTGQDWTAQEAAQNFINQFGLTAPTPQAAQQPQTVASREEVPVIPTVKGGGSTNPARKKVMSLEDIETAYKNL